MPKGRLAIMPGMVEAAAIKPISGSDAPKLRANNVNVGLFDIVELKIANKPITQSEKKGAKTPRVDFFKFLAKLFSLSFLGRFYLSFC